MSAWRGRRSPSFSSLVSIMQTWWLGTTMLTHSDSEYATQADWVTESNTSLWRFEHSRCDWLNHTTVVPHESSEAPPHGNWVNIVSFFNTIQTPICYVGCLMIAKAWTYISLYIRNIAILVNKKFVCISPHKLVNTCDLHVHTLKTAQNVRTIPVKTPLIG